MISNALTVDVEDYFQVSAFADIVRTDDWDSYECRVERNTARLLKLFDDAGVKATFFVLGWIASRYPQVVRDIAAQGHEVACHGFSHQLVYNQKPEIFKQETKSAKALLEDQAQTAVLGYRAASYSITKRSLWALDILHESGFRYDSSIYPVYHDRYGIPDAVREPHELTTPNGHRLAEFPIATLDLTKYTLPIGGGGYFRLFPYAFTRWGLSRINGKEERPFIFYLHPWEIDPEQPRLPGRWFSRFRHYNNLARCEPRLVQLLKDFNFEPAKDILLRLGLLQLQDAAECESRAAV